MTRVGRWLILAAAVCLTATAAFGQEKPAERPKTLLEEIVLFSYIENSVVFNLNGNGRGNHNELRLYDFDRGYTFNRAEVSAKKDPSERYPFGFGVVLTAGQDAQKNHALGIFRDSDDAFPFRNAPAFDLEEAYGSYKVPLGSGLTVKAGKFVTLLGYEVIESPNNLNFSRSFLFGFAIPLTHRGALVAAGTRNDTDATWWGIAAYAAYDWTEQLRTALRLEYFDDPESVRTAAQAAGSRTSLWEVTGTLQYKIWKGLVGRLEYRHDQGSEKVFKFVNHGLTP